MRFPCEYVASSFLPSLRIRIAHQLRDKGKSQNEISKLLGVKQPVIVSYLQKNIKDTGDEKINHHLDSLSESISSFLAAKIPIDQIMRTICTKCKSLRVNGPICSVHKSILPELLPIENCDICSGYDTLPSLKERAIVLNSLKETYNQLDKVNEFLDWVPEIGTQLVACNKDASELDDVASFPGRIIKVKDRTVVVSEPEFGSSKTMSLLLLWIREFQPNIKWILSLKNKTQLLPLLKKKNISYIETAQLDTEWDSILKSLSKDLRTIKMQVLLDTASSGYESIAYLFAETDINLIELLKTLIE